MTVSSYFHLASRLASSELSVQVDGVRIPFDKTPKYLGITLDRTLSYKPHIEAVAGKVRARNNLLNRLAGSSWGSNFDLLQTSVLALSYSTAEYCCPVWADSRHTRKLDSALNEGMRLISGAIRSTPVEQLPVLSGIIPPDIRRQTQKYKLFATARNSETHMLHRKVIAESLDTNHSRLTTRKPLLRQARGIGQNGEATTTPNTWAINKWQDRWNNSNCQLHHYMPRVSTKPAGKNLHRAHWVKLNRLRSGHGRYKSYMHQIGLTDSPNCICGEIQTAQHVLQCRTIGMQGSMTEVDEAFCNWLQTSPIDI